MNRDEQMTEARSFKKLRISLASPEDILSWSYGEVTKPETINYRRLRPEKDGLFCEAIFGPTRDYQCYCGKYKGIRYKGIICDKCGVEVTRSSVRRERMGHIQLAAPVAHIWYTRRVPSHLGILLDISKRKLDRVLYFAQYIIISVDEEARTRALKRLEEEEQSRVDSMNAFAQRRIAEMEGLMKSRPLEEEIAEEMAALDEELNRRTEAILSEARQLQMRLEGMKGTEAQQPILFSPTETIIAAEGEIIGGDHLVALNQLAQDALDALEAEIERRKAALVGKEESEEEQMRRAVLEDKIARLREELHDKIERIHQEYENRREELLDIAPLQLLNEARYRELRAKWGQVFKAGMGAEAIYEILRHLDLDSLSESLWNEVRNGRSAQRRKKATRRLRVVEALRKSGNRPEWMILTILPVLPPELRPMVQLDGGRFATSDLNDLYRRVINRNNRLKRLIDLGAPEVIIHNEKRMLQEAVDSLIDNSQRGKAMSSRGRRQLKSLSDMLKGKKGRFRRNLLGKRVDYSGRSVIVVGPHLKMHQCGLPKTMALELYRPFIIQRLVAYNYATNVKAAKRLIEKQRPEVWAVLEEVIGDRPVMLNRAPTLHRLGIQAFEPILIEGKAIQLHPLVCAAFNADFDGDQMAVHIPLSRKAVEEARQLMLATRNILKPADGHPIIGPSKDMCLGIYYMTMEGREKAEKPQRAFTNIDEVERAYELHLVDLHTPIYLAQPYDERPQPDRPIETTVGRALFNRIVPDALRYINRPMSKSDLNDLIALCYRKLGREATVELADAIKNLGFHYATVSGVTISVYDLTIPPEKQEIIDQAHHEVNEIDRQYRRGLLTEAEQYERTIEIWTRTREEISKAVAKHLDPYGPIAIMANSGASKGGFGPIAQLSGMRGLMADPSGRIIPLPILSNLREGLTALEYFISTHGSRKGLADTALRTADAGYLTRRLVDTAQDVIINAKDCGTRLGIWIRRSDDVAGQTMAERILGRLAAAPIVHPETGEIIVERDEEIDEEKVAAIEEAGVEEVYVRSPMTCELPHGICAKCYGRDLGRGKMVHVGAAVGIIAAQSIGEPGTQLTLRTFHTGGTASSSGDITSGLPRVEELLEARKTPKGEAEISDIGGIVHLYNEGDIIRIEVVDSQVREAPIEVPEGWTILVEDGDEVEFETPLAANEETEEIIKAPRAGRIHLEGHQITLIYDEEEKREYEVPASARLLVREGQHIEAGTQLVEGVPNPHRILEVQGREALQTYLLTEVQKVYRTQGVNINDKHFEIIIRKMLSKVSVIETGDSDLLPGDLIDRKKFEAINEKLIAEGKRPAKAKQVLLGITKAALATDSFLAAASFQHTIKVLSNAAIAGKEDPLYGLKENVIIGKLIPAGTGYRGDIEGSDGPIEEYEGVPIEKELPKGTLLVDEEEEPQTFLPTNLPRM